MHKIPSKVRSGRSWLVPLLAALALAVVLALPGLACPRTSCPGCGGTRCARTQTVCPGCGGQARLCAGADCPYALCPDCGSWQCSPRQDRCGGAGCHRGGGHHGGRR